MQAVAQETTLSFAMSRQSDKGTIGFSAMVIQETANRQMEGVLRHLEETSGFRLRDFRLFSGPSADAGAPPPPWKTA